MSPIFLVPAIIVPPIVRLTTFPIVDVFVPNR
jgi:hypothetical protein